MPFDQRRSTTAFRALRFGFAALALAAGADKYFHRLASWEMYLSATVESRLPFGPGTFFALAGAVEIAVGLALLTPYGRIAAGVLAAWLAGIALQLMTTGMFYDVALRDGALAVAAFALARMPDWSHPPAPTRPPDPRKGEER